MASFVKAFAWFLILEFFIFFFSLIFLGAFTDPLQIVQDIATSIGTTVTAITVGFFIIGTMVNLCLMFINSIRGSVWG